LFDPNEIPDLKKAITDCTKNDKKLLDNLCIEVNQFKNDVRTVRSRSATAVSLVASDGGNIKLVFDPFYIQLIRVVDSYGKMLCLDSVSPTTDLDLLNKSQFDKDGKITALGQLMLDLGVDPPTLHNLSPMIPDPKRIKTNPNSISSSWIQVYRDLCEWAALYERICHRSFATDTLIIRDGLLRSVIFNKNYFKILTELMNKSIMKIFKEDHRRVFLVGIAKRSKVLERYRLAMAIQNTFPPDEARYVRIPRELESKAYLHPEYAQGVEESERRGEAAGHMFFVRFGTRSSDPIWTVDIFYPQINQAQEIFGYLLADAIDGFPIPFYPRSLQKAHEYAQIADFDLDILENCVVSAIREIIAEDKQQTFEALRLQDGFLLRS
jgi:hypothetical protein